MNNTVLWMNGRYNYIGVYRDSNGVYKITPYNHYSLISKLIPFNPFSLHLTLVDPVEQFAHNYDGFLQNLYIKILNEQHSVAKFFPRL